MDEMRACGHVGIAAMSNGPLWLAALPPRSPRGARQRLWRLFGAVFSGRPRAPLLWPGWRRRLGIRLQRLATISVRLRPCYTKRMSISVRDSTEIDPLLERMRAAAMRTAQAPA